jgi:acyl-CoA synthetase (AMP-forming)/AMP-acid ligase II
VNVTDPIRQQARTTPGAVALIDGAGTRMTYRQMDAAIDQAARRALVLGMRAGDVVAMTGISPVDSRSLLLILALARIGVATGGRGLQRREARWVLAEPHRNRDGNFTADETWFEPDPDGASVSSAQDEETLFRVLESSGTTGEPKYIPISHRVMNNRVWRRIVCDGGGPAVRIIQINLGSGWGLATLFRTFWQGGTIVLCHGPDVVERIDRLGVTQVSATPTAVRDLLEARPADAAPFASLQALEVGSARLPMQLYEQARDHICANVVTSIAGSESGGLASAPFAVMAGIPDGAGYVWPGVEAQAVDAKDQPLPAGTEGILRMRSNMLATCYLGDPAATEAAFRDGWFYSGDVGAIDADGLLTLTGRASELINAGGLKVAPHHPEDKIRHLAGVKDVAVFGLPDSSGINEIWAALVVDGEIDEAVINAFCAQHLGAFAPAVLLQFTELPRNENGKLRRDLLVEYARELNKANPA